MQSVENIRLRRDRSPNRRFFLLHPQKQGDSRDSAAAEHGEEPSENAGGPPARTALLMLSLALGTGREIL